MWALCRVSIVAHADASNICTGFYAGLTPAVVGITPYMGLNFALYETFKKISTGLPSQKDDLPVDANLQSATKKKKDSAIVALAKKGLCGGAAGGLSKLIVYPLVSCFVNCRIVCVS